MNILAIESSCDETAAAVVKEGTEIISNVIATSSAMHAKWGGIVPEVAAREQLKCILPVVQEALQPFGKNNDISQTINKHIDTIAVTVGPGLIGSLLIGVETAKSIAYITDKPIIPVNHVLAHMYANVFQQDKETKILFPAISLVVSGGHTELFLMKSEKELMWLGGTLDDAAGEAFDKTARLLGFGSRGGLAIQEAASQYVSKTQKNKTKVEKLPRPLMYDGSLNFSFSGLKTAIVREVIRLKQNQQYNDATIQQLSYEVQESITDVLVKKTLNATELHNAQSILISGGVSSNLCLREKFQTEIQKAQQNIRFFSPPIPLCTDNAAYIGSYAFFRGEPTDWQKIKAIPDLSVEV